MEFLKAIALGAVQGATEFLPISSSGHLSILQHFMHLSGEGSLALTVFLHIGTLIAVIAVYYKTFWDMIKEIGLAVKDLFTGKIKETKTENRHLLYMFIISCLPLLLVVLPIGHDIKLKDLADKLAGDGDIVVEGVMLLITAALLLGATYVAKKKKDARDRVEAKDAILVGVAQLFAAILPGISRSGSTISTGMLCGVDKNYMVRYSFVLGTPAVLAASLFEIKDVLEGGAIALDIGPVIVGIIVAAVVGVASIKLLEMLVKTDKFEIFGYYCLVVGLVVTILGIIEKF
ncbi:MAG: undecaprenyl-diphosphate phosphatase [Clostridia bacterium]|nr:undecaprenyl-diphosphate phosphatase [Clostridia bacterium]